jgi:hypothetical protein
MPVGRGESAAEHLVHAHEQFGRVLRAQHLVDDPVDLWIPERVDVLEPEFLLAQPFAQEPGGIRVVKDVPAGFQLHLEFREGQRPRPERLHEPAFPIEETRQAPGIFRHRKLSSEQSFVAGKR